MLVKCVCIDDANKPAPIPFSKWIIRDNHYHITHVYYCVGQGLQGVALKEVSLDDSCTPYLAYKLSRFAFTKEEFLKLLQLMKDCTELNEIDIQKLVEEALTEENLIEDER